MKSCPKCGCRNEDRTKFCGECGASLDTLAASALSPPPSSVTLADELTADPVPLTTGSAADTLRASAFGGTIVDEPETAGVRPPEPPATAKVFVGDRDQYEIKGELGRGGMSVVSRAYDRKLDREVALKRLLPEYACRKKAVDRLMVEARAIAGLKHPNIVLIYDVDQDSQGPYIAMEYVEGKNGEPQTLEKRIKSGGVMNERDTVELLLKLCQAMGHAHAKGIVHRDIKPANILLTADGTPKLLDFGIAHVAKGTAGDAGGMTMEGATLGTPDYMAPEQENNAATVDQRADIYSLGGVLNFCLTGYSARYFRESSLPLRIRPAVIKALERDPQRRHGTVAEFAEALSGQKFELLPLQMLTDARVAVNKAFRSILRQEPAAGETVEESPVVSPASLLPGVVALIAAAWYFASTATFFVLALVLLILHHEFASPEATWDDYLNSFGTLAQRSREQIVARGLLFPALLGAALVLYLAPWIVLGCAGAAALGLALHRSRLLTRPLSAGVPALERFENSLCPTAMQNGLAPNVVVAIGVGLPVLYLLLGWLPPVLWHGWIVSPRYLVLLPSGLGLCGMMLVWLLPAHFLVRLLRREVTGVQAAWRKPLLTASTAGILVLALALFGRWWGVLLATAPALACVRIGNGQARLATEPEPSGSLAPTTDPPGSPAAAASPVDGTPTAKP